MAISEKASARISEKPTLSSVMYATTTACVTFQATELIRWQNYEDGDEIILVGFSRGAFTARSIGGLISSIGLLTKHGLSAFYTIFKDWEYQADPKYKPQFGTASWPVEDKAENWTRPKFTSPAYLKELYKVSRFIWTPLIAEAGPNAE